jgi:hypothetical protein
VREDRHHPAYDAPEMTIETRLLRPMPFGRVKGSDVRDPIIEPLWVGARALARVRDGEATLTDDGGDEIEGFVDLRRAVAAASLAASLVVDGYLTEPLRETTGVAVPVSGEAMRPGQMGRQMLLGGGSAGQEERRDQIDTSLGRRPVMPAEDASAFVAIDLLELDGESLFDVPLLERKRLLESALDESERVRRTAIVRPPAAPWFGQWRALGFVEMAYKAANGRYTPGVASTDWAIVRIPRR